MHKTLTYSDDELVEREQQVCLVAEDRPREVLVLVRIDALVHCAQHAAQEYLVALGLELLAPLFEGGVVLLVEQLLVDLGLDDLLRFEEALVDGVELAEEHEVVLGAEEQLVLGLEVRLEGSRFAILLTGRQLKVGPW